MITDFGTNTLMGSNHSGTNNEMPPLTGNKANDFDGLDLSQMHTLVMPDGPPELPELVMNEFHDVGKPLSSCTRGKRTLNQPSVYTLRSVYTQRAI